MKLICPKQTIYDDRIENSDTVLGKQFAGIIVMIYRFKTNIQCNGCIETITPYLDANNEIKRWQIDISSPDKVLTVETDHLTNEMVREIIKIAGYKAENLNQ